MNKFKASTCFKWLVDQMRDMILELLSPLDVNEIEKKLTRTINRATFNFFMIMKFFHPQTHIPANTANIVISLHMITHFPQSLLLRDSAHIKQNRKLRLKLLTETIEEPIMRR